MSSKTKKRTSWTELVPTVSERILTEPIVPTLSSFQQELKTGWATIERVYKYLVAEGGLLKTGPHYEIKNRSVLERLANASVVSEKKPKAKESKAPGSKRRRRTKVQIQSDEEQELVDDLLKLLGKKSPNGVALQRIWDRANRDDSDQRAVFAELRKLLGKQSS